MKKKFYNYIAIMILALLVPVMASAQTGLLERADEYYNRLEYQNAITYYERAINKMEVPEYSALRNLAESYRKVRDNDNAEKYYKMVTEHSEAKAVDYYKYARTLLANNKYEEAQIEMAKYRELEQSELGSEYADFSMERIEKMRAKSDKYEVKKADFSTDGYDDFGPAKMGDQIVFSSNRGVMAGIVRTYAWDGKPFLDLYGAEVDENGEASSAKPFSKVLNSKYHEGNATFSSDGKEVFFTRNDYLDGEFGEGENGVNNLKIYTSMMDEDGNWSEPVAFPYNSSNFSTGHPSLSADGKTLYFVSDRPNGKGGADIYMSKRNSDGSWAEPVNLRSINTEGNEMFPFIHPEGNLYFASDGHFGLGGLDVFVAIPKSGGFEKPKNMGYPFNDANDDFGVWIDMDYSNGYLSSNRDTGSYGDDIYRFTMAPTVTELKVIVKDADSEEVLPGARVAVERSEDDFYDNGLTDNSGEIDLTITAYGEIKVSAEMDNYKMNEVVYEAVNRGVDMEDEVVVYLKEIKPEGPLVTEMDGYFAFVPIYFEYDKWDIQDQSEPKLDTIIQIMNDFPEYKVECYSHADCRGSQDFNQWLSEKRLEETIAYLVSKGVKRERIFGRAMGETEPVNECVCECEQSPAQIGITRYRKCEAEQVSDCSEEDHKMNRRTEFRLVRPE